MSRPKKCRKVCCMPKSSVFIPLKSSAENNFIILTVDEYETIRLIDKECFSQEQCGEYMQIARTPVQSIYNSARKKIAAALVDNISLKIEGGDYILCDGKEARCGCGGCQRHKCNIQHDNTSLPDQ